MNQLWAPWRMAYILSGDEVADACIFCQFPAEGPERQRERLILYCDPHALVIMNKFPYNNGHLMVVPRAHVADLAALSDDDYQRTMALVRSTIARLQAAFSPHGFNIGMNLGRSAGAGIDQHLHWHIVPRWNGDTNFMPVLGDVKVISEHLMATYDRLLPHFEGAAIV